MSKSNAFETAVLGLLFNATPIPNVADNAASAPLTDLYISAHTSDPGEAGNQQSNEATYSSYARVAVARSGSGFTVAGDTVTFAADVVFPEATGGAETITHAGIGSLSSGAGVLYYSGTVSPNITVATGVAPTVKATGSTIVES